MGKTSIEWTDASWNPIVGCTEVSPGCANCYAARLAATRLRHTPQYKGLAEMHDGKPRWSSLPAVGESITKLRFLPERLNEPLERKKPTKYFVCDMGDLFHEDVHGDWIDEVLTVVDRCPQHTFQILTKRAQRMHDLLRHYPVKPNIWLGVSVENQHFADERIPLLLETPAAVRWISAEPLLGPVDIGAVKVSALYLLEQKWIGRGGLDWVVCGGESGPNARPMHPDWARSLSDQCQAAGVPFFFKQWGEWGFSGGHPIGTPGAFYILGNDNLPISVQVDKYPRPFDSFGSCVLEKLGKKKAGRLLDGREWNEFPAMKGGA
jgi:protein gp37